MSNSYGLKVEDLYLFKEFPTLKSNIRSISARLARNNEILKETVSKAYYASILLLHKGIVKNDDFFKYAAAYQIENMLNLPYLGNMSLLQVSQLPINVLEAIALTAKNDFIKLKKNNDERNRLVRSRSQRDFGRWSTYRATGAQA